MQRSFLALLLAAGCALAALTGGARPAAAASTDITIDIVTSMGTIQAVLDPVHAPISTKNFLHYIDTKFFNGGSFFRSVPGFVIQGGNKTKEGPSDVPIKLETPYKTGLKNVDGSLAMARTSDPDSATSEFFIDDGDQGRLDGTATEPGYAVFGHVTKNMDLVRKIARLPAESQMLLAPVKIIKIVRVP